ncbi:MAG: gamma-glutamyltransferase, partial [Gemmatimonadota bacterium]|nr:gamma-glutamyltransferase [Gemmatimonadota bacterium]
MRILPATFCAPILVTVLAACSVASADTAQSAQDSGAPLPVAGRSTVYAPHGIIATSQPLASAAGLRVLEAGGNAFDAAIAASAVLSLVEPHMTGLGGDLFALFWSADEDRLVGLDATGRAGSRSTPEQIRSDGFDRMPGSGPQAVTVPGAIAGWAALNEKYGSMPLDQILERAIDLAENGFPVSPIIADQWQGQLGKLQSDPGATTTYLVDGERAPTAGEWFTNPDLGRSLRMVAEEGADAMYGGALGRQVVDGLEELGGYLTTEDMEGMEVRWVDPISADYKGWTVWELPPAGQGVAALQMLELVEPFDLRRMGHNSPEYLHTLIEAKKLAFADLARYVADADHMEVTTDELLDPDYLSERRGMIDAGRAAERVEPGELVTHSETIYLSVADQYGNQVSFI